MDALLELLDRFMGRAPAPALIDTKIPETALAPEIIPAAFGVKRLKCPACANVREPGGPTHCLHRHKVDDQNDWAIKWRMLPV